MVGVNLPLVSHGAFIKTMAIGLIPGGGGGWRAGFEKNSLKFVLMRRYEKPVNLISVSSVL